MTRVLLTGFDPFAGAARNPSWDAVQRLVEQWDGPHELIAERLPVEFGAATVALHDALTRHEPELVIAVGLAEGRTAITPERIGINVDDARIPDNGGDRPVDRPIDPRGPDARFSTLPIKAIVGALSRAGIPAKVSDSAGTYVCNHVLYVLQGVTEGSRIRSGFIHVPATPETGLAHDIPTMPLDEIVRGLRLALETTLES